MARSRELIQSALSACPAGPRRASLLLRLATIHYHQSGWPLAEQTFRQAAEEAPDDPALSRARRARTRVRPAGGRGPSAASRLAKASLRSAEQAADPRLVAHSLARIAVFEFLQGHGARLDLLDRAEALDAAVRAEPLARLPSARPSPWSEDSSSNGATGWTRRGRGWPTGTETGSTAETRHRCRSCSTTSASSSAGPGTGTPPRNTRWRHAGWPMRAASSR